METALAVVVGGLVACGLYLMMRRSLVKLILGLVLLSHAVNLLIFTAAGLRRGRPPFIPPAAAEAPPTTTDPLPQAMILTAVVIAFGVAAFSLVLLKRTQEEVKSDDLDDYTITDIDASPGVPNASASPWQRGRNEFPCTRNSAEEKER